jgi:hypothetical protein
MLFIWLQDQWGEYIRDFFLNPNPDPCMGPDPHF